MILFCCMYSNYILLRQSIITAETCPFIFDNAKNFFEINPHGLFLWGFLFNKKISREKRWLSMQTCMI